MKSSVILWLLFNSFCLAQQEGQFELVKSLTGKDVANVKSIKSTPDATIKIVGGVPTLFFREGEETEFSKGGIELPVSTEGQHLKIKAVNWCFSPDGKFVVIGSAGYLFNKSADVQEGAITVFRTDRKLDGIPRVVNRFSKKIGPILWLGFSEEGKKLFYQADRHMLDGL